MTNNIFMWTKPKPLSLKRIKDGVSFESQYDKHLFFGNKTNMI